jgi:ribose transport system substrate-binding protein
MTNSTKLALTATTALIATAGIAAAQSVTIGITQNNVGVDSYQTTYEQAFIAAAEANPDV